MHRREQQAGDEGEMVDEEAELHGLAVHHFIPRGYVFTIFPFLEDPSVTRVDQVTSPVLVQLGERDVLAPGALAGQEAAVWSSASSVTVQVLPDIGHSFNAHRTAVHSWSGIHSWLSQTLSDR
jgi:pimeloyl-ACP methyl ester carboxylesterase